MKEHNSKNLNKVIQIDEDQIKDHLGELVRCEFQTIPTTHSI